MPSALQIRIGGNKGMVVVDPRLEGKQLCTRKSQCKFDAHFTSIEVCIGGESVFKPGHLNRQLILVLYSRRTGQACRQVDFESLQDQMTNQLKLLYDASLSRITLTPCEVLEAAKGLHPRAIVLDMLRGGVEPSSEELLSRMLRQLAKAHLERLRDSGRIRVQDACLLKRRAGPRRRRVTRRRVLLLAAGA